MLRTTLRVAVSAASGSGSQISRLGGTIEQALRKRFPGQDPFEVGRRHRSLTLRTDDLNPHQMAWERFQENLRTATPDERDTMIVRRRLWILNFDPSFTGRVGLPIYPFYRNAEITKAVTFGNRPIPAPLLARLQHQTYNFYTLSFLIESPPQPPSTLEVQHINRSLDRMFEASRDVGKAGGDELADIFEETSRLTRLDYRKLVRMLEGMDAEEARWLWQQEVEAERAVIKEEQEAKKRAASSGT